MTSGQAAGFGWPGEVATTAGATWLAAGGDGLVFRGAKAKYNPKAKIRMAAAPPPIQAKVGMDCSNPRPGPPSPAIGSADAGEASCSPAATVSPAGAASGCRVAPRPVSPPADPAAGREPSGGAARTDPEGSATLVSSVRLAPPPRNRGRLPFGLPTRIGQPGTWPWLYRSQPAYPPEGPRRNPSTLGSARECALAPG